MLAEQVRLRARLSRGLEVEGSWRRWNPPKRRLCPPLTCVPALGICKVMRAERRGKYFSLRWYSSERGMACTTETSDENLYYPLEKRLRWRNSNKEKDTSERYRRMMSGNGTHKTGRPPAAVAAADSNLFKCHFTGLG